MFLFLHPPSAVQGDAIYMPEREEACKPGGEDRREAIMGPGAGAERR